MKPPAYFLLVFVAAAFSFSAVNAAVVTLSPSKDNAIFQSPDSNSDGLGPHFYVGRTASGSLRRALLAFDIAGSIPAGSFITDVTLTLNMSQAPTSGPATTLISLFTLLADWGEGTSDSGSPGGSGATATPGDATWNRRFFDTVSWTTAGGDFDPVASASTSVNKTEGLFTWNSSGLVSDVQAWLDDPASNFGWILRGDEATNTTARRFDSRDNSTVAVRPQLTITYSPIPEPATFGLFALGLLPILRNVRWRGFGK